MKATDILLCLIIAAIIALAGYSVGYHAVKTITTTDTVKVASDTIRYTDTTTKPYPIFKDTGSIQYIAIPIDTALIFDAYTKLHHLYYTRNIYNDTLKNDTSALVIIADTVYKNELQNRRLTFVNYQPKYYITKSTQLPEPNQWLLGANITGIRGDVGFDVSILFQNKGVAYRYAYNPLSGEHSVGAYVRILPRSRSPAK